MKLGYVESISEMILEAKERLNEKYGEGNWKIRKVSRIRRDDDTPSLTVVDELKKAGLKPGDLIVIAIVGDTVVIEKL